MTRNLFFNFFNKCNHANVPLDTEVAYCPDCGELVENHWFITRCECCGLKLRATVKNGEVVPEGGFCRNCGGCSYTVEEIEKPDCTNINCVILLRKVVKSEITECVQSWTEAVDPEPKLLR